MQNYTINGLYVPSTFDLRFKIGVHNPNIYKYMNREEFCKIITDIREAIFH